MSKDNKQWSEPSEGKKAGFGKFKKLATAYDKFMEEEGIPVFRDLGIRNVRNLPLAPGNGPVVKVATSSSMGRKESGGAMSSKYHLPVPCTRKTHVREDLPGRGRQRVHRGVA